MNLAKVSNKQRDLLIKGDGAALLSPATGSSEGYGSAVKLILTSAAADDDGCTMAKNKLEKGEISVEEGIGTKGPISAEDLDILIKGGGAVLLSPATRSSEGCGSAVRFTIISAASDDDGCMMAKIKLDKGRILVEEEIGSKVSISAEDLDLLIKGGGAALLSPPTGSSEGWGSAVKFILRSSASNDDGCTMAENKLEKGEISVEEGVGTKGPMSAETLGSLIQAVANLLPGQYGLAANACGIILKYAPSPSECLEMVENRFEKTKSWTEKAKSWYGTSKSWAEEKIKATGISDEHIDLVVKGGGVLLATAAAVGYLRGKNPRAYFRG